MGSLPYASDERRYQIEGSSSQQASVQLVARTTSLFSFVISEDLRAYLKTARPARRRLRRYLLFEKLRNGLTLLRGGPYKLSGSYIQYADFVNEKSEKDTLTSYFTWRIKSCRYMVMALIDTSLIRLTNG